MSVLNNKQSWSTPCVGVCTATALGDKYCRGCKRTELEIYHWNSMTKEEKTKLNAELKQRNIYTGE